MDSGNAVTGGYICPLPDTSAAPDENLANLEFYVHDSSATYYVSVEVCRTFWDTNGGACGTAVNSGAAFSAGHKTIALTDLGELVSDDFGYLNVLQQNGTLLKGYWGST